LPEKNVLFYGMKVKLLLGLMHEKRAQDYSSALLKISL
jgi:hypothetical protein